MKKIYIVKYCGGSSDDWYEVNLFVTDKKSTAIRYVNKFNKILGKWKKHYRQYEENRRGIMPWLKAEYVEKYFHRWSTLREIDKCYWNEIDFR